MREAVPEQRRSRSEARREITRLAFLLLPIALIYGFAALRNHALYGTAAFDLGIFDQGLWHASRFETPTSTLRQIPSIFADHIHPAILLLVPFYWLGIGTGALLALQPFVVLLAAFPIYAFARRRMDAWPATLLALAYALSWGVARGLGFDFHELAFAAPAVAFAIERFDARDACGFWIAALAMLLAKEDQSLTLVMFGVLAALRRDGWRPALAPVVVGLGWYVLSTRVLSPFFGEGRPYEHWLYGYLAPTPVALGLYLVSHPVRALTLLVAPKVKITLWYRTFVAFALLPLLSPLVLLMVPSLLSRLLSPQPIHWEPSFHYSLPIMAIGACAAADTLGRLAKRFGDHAPRLMLAGSALVFLLSFGMNRFVLQIDQLLRPRTSPTLARELDALLARIPAGASVTTDNFVAPHLSHRDWILLTSDENRMYRTDFYVFDPAVPPGASKLAARMYAGLGYEEVGRAGPTVLYRRRPQVPSDLPARPQDLPSLIHVE